MESVTLESIAPSASVAAQYKRSIDELVRDMRQDFKTSVIANYRSELAMDGIIDWIGHVVDSWVGKWTDRLDQLSNEVAQDFVGKTKTNYDKRLMRILKRRGFTVRFTNSKRVQDQAQIAIGENTSLIKSVGSQYLDNVRAAVWSSVKDGYDLESLIKQLKHIDGVTDRRAKIIAKDQVAKVNQDFEDARCEELGITEAIWLHSHAGKQPRPSHVKANGTRYNIKQGLYLDGAWTWPAFQINCRCRKKLIIELKPQNNLTFTGVQG